MKKEMVIQQLQKLGVTPKRGKGQNFLIADDIIKQTMEQANLTKEDIVVEVGPGLGFLTQELLKQAKQVIAIELEQNFCTFLTDKFKEQPFHSICKDVLEVNMKELTPEPYTVVANLPYSITSPILQHFLYNAHPPKRMIVMVQKEVGERICATPGDHSILSLSVQRVSNPRILFLVPKTSFYPEPKVDSVILELADIHLSNTNEKFFQIVKAGFAQKRKKLIKNLVVLDTIDPEKLKKAFEELELTENTRAQELSLEQWTKLVELL